MGRWSDKKNDSDIHHLNEHCNWGSEHPDNLVEINRNKHEAYHTFFWNLWVIEALKELFTFWSSAISDGKAKQELMDCLNDLTYKDTCKTDKKKKRK